MFVKTISGVTDGSVDAFKYSDVIDLTSKKYDSKKLALKLNLTSVAATGTLDVNCVMCEQVDGTYATFNTGNGGSSIFLSGATYTSLGNGSYYVPLTIVVSSGVTRLLESAPFIKFGFRALTFNVPFDAWLCVG